jgi:hypothetical protein
MIEGGKLYPDMLRLLHAHRPPQGYDLLVCDVAGRQRQGDTGLSFLNFMRDHGLRFHTQAQGIASGVNVVRSRLLNVENEVHLRFLRSGCPKTISALENYHYPEGEGPVSEEPEKDGTNDHPMDALRYYCVYRHARKPGRSWVA